MIPSEWIFKHRENGLLFCNRPYQWNKTTTKLIVYICQKWQGWKSCAITTLGRGGSDLTATTIGKALGLPEIQVCLIQHKLKKLELVFRV